MAEVGLVLFAKTALGVMLKVLPPYGSKYSKHTFTQPQLMTILCLMRFEDWTFREAEVRLAEHSDLRAALGLERAPDHTTLYRFMRRVTDEVLDEVLIAVAARVKVSNRAPNALATCSRRARSPSRTSVTAPRVMSAAAGYSRPSE